MTVAATSSAAPRGPPRGGDRAGGGGGGGGGILRGMRVRWVGGGGPLVVKLAGLAGGVGLLQAQAERVAREGFRVALLDTGGDRADDPAPGPIGWDFLAGEVVR